MQKAASTSTHSLLVLLDLVDSALLLFSEEGNVVFANRAAKAMDSRPALVLGSDPHVRGMVGAIAKGQIVTQMDLRVEALSDQGVTQLDCRFAPKPIAGLVAVAVNVVTPKVPSPQQPATDAAVDPRLSLQQIMELLRGDLLPPIQDVINQARAVQPLEAMRDLKDSLAALTERLDRLVDLVDVFGDDVLITDERILMVDLVRSTCQELAPSLRGQRVSFLFKGEKDDLPPVYGSQRMIRRALYECLHNAVVHARQSIDPTQQVGVEIGFRASGHHLLVKVSNMGALSAAALNHHASALFRPALPDAGGPADTPPVMRIGLPLARRILQLHGGRLRMEQDSTQETRVMLELPTGAPRRNTHHLDMLQAQIYAEDLSKLLARGRARSDA